MLISVGDTSAKKTAFADEGIGTLVKSAAILRIGAGVVLGWFHGWPGVVGGYQFLWKEQPWEWVVALDKAHVPYPHLVAPVAAIIIGAVALSWTLGFVTRLFSIAFIPVTIAAFVVAQRSGSAHLEACGLYLFIAITLLLFGSGNISLDWFFNLGQRPKAQPKRR